MPRIGYDVWMFLFWTPSGCHVDELGRYIRDFLMFLKNCQGFCKNRSAAVDDSFSRAVDHENHRLLKVPDLQGQYWMRLNIVRDSTDA